MSYPCERIRLQFQLGVVANAVDAPQASTVDAWRRENWRFELSFSRLGQLQNISHFSSIRLLVMPDDQRTGAALLDRVATNLVPVITEDGWQLETEQQAVVEFTADETNLDLLGKDERLFYAVALVFTTDSRWLVAGYSQIRVVESGAWKDGQLPPQGGNLIPAGVVYDASGHYVLPVTAGRAYQWAIKGANDTSLTNGVSTQAAIGIFNAATGTITLNGAAGTLVTSVIWSEFYLTAGQSDARYYQLRPRGAWSSVAEYLTGDAVSYQGSTWRAKRTSTNATPPTLPVESNADWEMVARRGDTGPAGSGSLVTDADFTGAVNGTNAVFVMAQAYSAGSMRVTYGGIRQKKIHFTETDNVTVTLSFVPESGTELVFDYEAE